MSVCPQILSEFMHTQISEDLSVQLSETIIILSNLIKTYLIFTLVDKIEFYTKITIPKLSYSLPLFSLCNHGPFPCSVSILLFFYRKFTVTQCVIIINFVASSTSYTYPMEQTKDLRKCSCESREEYFHVVYPFCFCFVLFLQTTSKT